MLPAFLKQFLETAACLQIIMMPYLFQEAESGLKQLRGNLIWVTVILLSQELDEPVFLGSCLHHYRSTAAKSGDIFTSLHKRSQQAPQSSPGAVGLGLPI